MLEGMRAASKNWVGKTIMAIVMGFIIFSFAIWGIGDIFRNFGSSRLAKVGDTEISTEAYRQSYQTELQRLQRQARRPITNEQARQMGLDSQVLSRLITEAALDQNAKTLGLASGTSGDGIANEGEFAQRGLQAIHFPVTGNEGARRLRHGISL